MTENAKMILKFLQSHPSEEFTKQEIAAELGVSVATVTGTVNGLIRAERATDRVETIPDPNKEGKTKDVHYVMLNDAGLMFDPEAEEERIKAEKARAKEEKARAKAEKGA